ncbi:hypothetical protein JJC03_07145 [Flavobacterium oreochromis]|uniref:DUF7738 domain-containing protein n=1 Tax=Flavobacterium oreochromis TaxID=2906078 RepID=UPI001CE4C1A1|nr:hypothetical protein [Flavobacterium oreochromis]QYS87581.1 hypothetical protein JJC03_07145 [Flavobacterium oreochromis]
MNSNIVALLFLLITSCQSKGQNKEINPQGFCIQDTLLYYNAKRINVGEPIANFVKIAGKPDRIVTDSLGGNTNKTWKWHKTGDEAYLAENNKIKVFNSNSTEESKVFNSIEEVIKKYGKYDEYKEEKQPLNVRKYYIWDKLGFYAYTNQENFLKSIYINIFHPNKINVVSKEQIQDPHLIYNNTPNGEYKGMFTYDGHTVDFSKMGYDNWFKTIKELKIEGEQYDPPGDSKKWSRIITEDNLTIEIFRHNNSISNGEGYSVEKVGEINTVTEINIFR